MATYGHERFIAQAIDGVLMQDTSFSFELIIANDHSPDGTDQLVQNYINNHPKGNLIRYFHNQKNMGMLSNFLFALDKTKGRYIAICEGDDYWTDPLKLQKQVDFLDLHENINVCFHQIDYVDINSKNIGSPEYQFDCSVSQYLSYENLIESWNINTCSIVFRKTFERVPSFINTFKVGDQPLFYFMNMNKCSYYIHDVMASYRITDLGSTGTFVKNELKSDLEFPFLDKINELSNNKYSNVIKRRKSRTVIKDLKFMKTNGKYKFITRAEFYFKHLFYLLNYQRGIKVTFYCFFKYVI